MGSGTAPPRSQARNSSSCAGRPVLTPRPRSCWTRTPCSATRRARAGTWRWASGRSARTGGCWPTRWTSTATRCTSCGSGTWRPAGTCRTASSGPTTGWPGRPIPGPCSTWSPTRSTGRMRSGGISSAPARTGTCSCSARMTSGSSSPSGPPAVASTCSSRPSRGTPPRRWPCRPRTRARGPPCWRPGGAASNTVPTTPAARTAGTSTWSATTPRRSSGWSARRCGPPVRTPGRRSSRVRRTPGWCPARCSAATWSWSSGTARRPSCACWTGTPVRSGSSSRRARSSRWSWRSTRSMRWPRCRCGPSRSSTRPPGMTLTWPAAGGSCASGRTCRAMTGPGTRAGGWPRPHPTGP